MWCFCFFCSEMKNSFCQIVQHFIKQTAKKKKGIQDIVNRNKIKFESYGDLVYQSFSQLNKNPIKNQDSHSQIENDITPGAKISQ